MVVDTGKPCSLTVPSLSVPPLDIFTISSLVFSRTRSLFFRTRDVRAAGDDEQKSIREYKWVYFSAERFSLVEKKMTKEK